MGMRSTRGTTGDYRHYPPCYPKEGVGITIDETDPVFPIISADDQGGITAIQGGSHIVVDNTEPKRPVIATSGLVDKVHGTGQIIVDNTDEDNPIVKTVGLVENITDDGNSSVIVNTPTANNKQVSFNPHYLKYYMNANQTVVAGSGYIAIEFDTQENSHGSAVTWDTTKYQLDFHAKGLYSITLCLPISPVSSSYNNVYLYSTHSAILPAPSLTRHERAGSTYYKTIDVTYLIYCSVTSGGYFKPLINSPNLDADILGGHDYDASIVCQKVG